VNPLDELEAALAGKSPEPRPCSDATDLAFWFWCLATALRVQRRRLEPRRVVIYVREVGRIRNVTTTVRVRVEDDAARRGRLTPDVRR
jgi:hypothetical protein